MIPFGTHRGAMFSALAIAAALAAPAALAEDAAPRAEAAPDGAALWKANCAKCHGAAGKGDTADGRKMQIRDLTAPAFQTARTDGQIRMTILEGLHEVPEKGPEKEMHAFRSELTAKQVDALVAHVRTLAPQ